MCIVHDIKTTQTTSISLCLASVSSSLPLPCLASVKDIAALPRLCLDKTALSPSLAVLCIYAYARGFLGDSHTHLTYIKLV